MNMKIDIECKDDLKYAQIAFLVDKPNFLLDVVELRSKWLKDNELIPFGRYVDWRIDLENKSLNVQRLVQDKLEQMKGDLRRVYTLVWNHNKSGDTSTILKEKRRIERLLPIRDFNEDIIDLSIKYRVPQTYFAAVATAVLCGKVAENDWENCIITLQPSHIRPPYLIRGEIMEEPECEIRVTPYTTESDVKKLLKDNIVQIRKMYEVSQYKIMRFTRRTLSEIRRDRDWYWLKQDHTYKEIAEIDKLTNSIGDINLYINAMKQAVRRYGRRLQIS